MLASHLEIDIAEVPMRLASATCRFIPAHPDKRTYGARFGHPVFVFLFFSARNLAHRNFVAFEIFALAAADITRFLNLSVSRVAVLPSAFAAARTPINLFCNLLNSFSSFRSSRLILRSE
jgi:hypothetical protein